MPVNDINRPLYSVGALTDLYEARIREYRAGSKHQKYRKRERVRFVFVTQTVRDGHTECKKNEDLNKLKSNHLVSDRKKWFETMLSVEGPTGECRTSKTSLQIEAKTDDDHQVTDEHMTQSTSDRPDSPAVEMVGIPEEENVDDQPEDNPDIPQQCVQDHEMQDTSQYKRRYQSIDQKSIAEKFRKSIKESLVQEFRELSLDSMEDFEDINEQEEATVCKSIIRSWSQQNLDHLNEDDQTDPESENQEEAAVCQSIIRSWSQQNLDYLNEDDGARTESSNDNDLLNENSSNATLNDKIEVDDYKVSVNEEYEESHPRSVEVECLEECLPSSLKEITIPELKFSEEEFHYNIFGFTDFEDYIVEAYNTQFDQTCKMVGSLFHLSMHRKMVEVSFMIDDNATLRREPSVKLENCDERIYETICWTRDFGIEENTNNSNNLETSNAYLEIPRLETQLSSSTPKPQFIIQELVDTELKYIENLEYVIDEYMTHFLKHPIKRRDFPEISTIFGNIESLYQSSSKFLDDLVKCGSSVDCIANVFQQSTSLFELYVEYMRNKNQTEEALALSYKIPLMERQMELNDQYGCESYLLAPVQRPPKHKLLLESLQKELRKMGEKNKNLESAILFVDQNIQHANTLVTIDSINGCPTDLKKFGGSYLLQDTFNIKGKFVSVVFLFEEIIVFTTQNKSSPKEYDYKNSINAINLQLTPKGSTKFVVKDYTECKNGDDWEYTFEIETAAEDVCTKWVNKIEGLLWHQHSHIKNLEGRRSHVEDEGPTKRILPQMSNDGPLTGSELVIKELIDTEITYIKTMKFFIDKYLKFFVNNRIRTRKYPKITTIFGNIELLYEGSKTLLGKLRNCKSSVDCIASVFQESKQLFEWYAEYIPNKFHAQEELEKLYAIPLAERQRDLNDKHTYDSYLATPAQRPVRYKLLLEELQKHLQKEGKENVNLEDAIIFVDQSIRKANTLIAIDCIYECPIDLRKFAGQYLLQDTFNIKRKYNSCVFLFERTIVFTTENKDKQNVYDYKDSINAIDLSMKIVTESSFIVSNYSMSKYSDDGPFSFEMETSSEVTSKKWVDQINMILWNQLSHLKEVEAKKSKSPNVSNFSISIKTLRRPKKSKKTNKCKQKRI